MKAWVDRRLEASERVDVFGAIERERVWLLFEPLEHLFGFFQREGEAAGIVLHSGHPLSVQRFTAAHELGHYLLGHHLSHDSRRELFATADIPVQEMEAQAFAAEFLMPLQLVNRALDRLSLPRQPHELTPLEAYQLSLEIGSSYTATVTQLNQLKKLSGNQLNALLAWKPIDIKVLAGKGERPSNPRSDVWLLDDELRTRTLHLRLGDQLHVRLPEIPTSGYRWEFSLGASHESLDLSENALDAAELTPEVPIGRGRQRICRGMPSLLRGEPSVSSWFALGRLMTRSIASLFRCW